MIQETKWKCLPHFPPLLIRYLKNFAAAVDGRSEWQFKDFMLFHTRYKSKGVTQQKLARVFV